ncbi:unnamed protein product [Chrysoparadoxa australica]
MHLQTSLSSSLLCPPPIFHPLSSVRGRSGYLTMSIDAATKDGILKHMNEDHADSSLLYAWIHAGDLSCTSASLVDIDLNGMTVEACSSKSCARHKLPFASPLESSAGIKTVLVKMHHDGLIRAAVPLTWLSFIISVALAMITAAYLSSYYKALEPAMDLCTTILKPMAFFGVEVTRAYVERAVKGSLLVTLFAHTFETVVTLSGLIKNVKATPAALLTWMATVFMLGYPAMSRAQLLIQAAKHGKRKKAQAAAQRKAN